MLLELKDEMLENVAGGEIHVISYPNNPKLPTLYVVVGPALHGDAVMEYGVFYHIEYARAFADKYKLSMREVEIEVED